MLVVGLSGGVDSSVALLLELTSGVWATEQVVGASHDICRSSRTCNDETLGRARSLCDRFGIPYHRLDMISDFDQSVIVDFVAAYLQGETPNPCVRCNERVRFDAFYQGMEKLLREQGGLASSAHLHIATGHYARKADLAGYPVIRRGLDTRKDQSYMLYRISPEVLPYVHFPLGDHEKTDIVSIAKDHGLPSSSVKESQDICFIPGKYTDFLKETLHQQRIAVDRPGIIRDTHGQQLGIHRGYMHYTIGQRQGLGLGNGPWYVRSIDASANEVIVCRADALGSAGCEIVEANWFLPRGVIQAIQEGVLREPLDHKPYPLSVKIRYNSRALPCTVEWEQVSGSERDQHAVIRFSQDPGPETAVTPGQSAVLYAGDRVLGGGIIRSAVTS